MFGLLVTAGAECRTVIKLMFVTFTEIENAELDTEVLPPLDLRPAGESGVRPPQRRLYEEEEEAGLGRRKAAEGLRGDESKEKGDCASSTEEEEEESRRLRKKKKWIVTADGDKNIQVQQF